MENEKSGEKLRDNATLDFGLLSGISVDNSLNFPDNYHEINRRLTEFFTTDMKLTDALNELAVDDRKFVIALFLRVCFGHKKSDAEYQMDSKILDGKADFGDAFVEALKYLLDQEFDRRQDYSGEKLNEEQNELFSHPFTIWHAVSKFGESYGRTSWAVVKFVVTFLSAEKVMCPWMRGDDLGVFGETPLHVALLCNEPSPEVEEMFLFLWERCEKIRELQYSAPKYKGENVLHLAIVRNYSVKFLEKIHKIHYALWEHLMEAAATGTFFNDKEEGCHVLGELPLFFAACYDRRDIFEYLISTGSKLKVVTSKGDNLLHVMIEREKVVSGTEMTKKLSMQEMLDCVFKTLRSKEDSDGKPIYEYLINQRNSKNMTPIMLAAAEGTPQIFEYFFEAANVEVAWVYGSVECVKIRLDGSDPVFCDSESSTKIHAGESLLELLVRNKRRDILTQSIIGQIIERKWQKYGSAIFCTRLFFSILYALAVISVPVFEWTSVRAAVHVFAIFILDQITHPTCFSETLLSQFVYRPLNKEGVAVGSQKFLVCFLNDLVTWVLWQSPMPRSRRSSARGTTLSASKSKHSGSVGGSVPQKISYIPLVSLWVLKTSFLVFLFSVVSGQPLDTLLVVHGYPLLHYLQTLCYTCSGILAFCNVVSSLIVFEGYGSLVFMLTNTLSRDLPMFAVAYLIFLICFAYYHFLASNNLHSGLMDQGVDSIWRIFSAMVGEFEQEDEKICRYTSTRVIVMGISVANYFFVTVVLVNLLIAFLTNTIEEISSEAQMEWRLQRARILLEEDARISEEQIDIMMDLMSRPILSESQKTSFNTLSSSSSFRNRRDSKKDLTAPSKTKNSKPQDRLREIEAAPALMDVQTNLCVGNSAATPKAKSDAEHPQSGMTKRKSLIQALSDRQLGKNAIQVDLEQTIEFLETWSNHPGAQMGSDAVGGQPYSEAETSAEGGVSATQSEQIFKLFYTVCFPLVSESTVKKLHETFLGSDSAVKKINDFKSKMIEFFKLEHQILKADNEDSNRNPTDDSDFDALNLERMRRNSINFSIWNAVSSFKSKKGLLSWQVVKAVIKILNSHGADCPWMRGDERGVFGETPLHLALLCNEPENKPFERMFTFLWDECPRLRTLEYKSDHYMGENVLHLAIVRGFSIGFLEQIRSCSDAWKTLTRGRAVGKFFKNPEYGIAPLGELPLFFAACVNRPDAFEYLAQDDKKLLMETTADERNNLLHVLILKEAAGGLWTSTEQSGDQSRLRFQTIEMVHRILKNIMVMVEVPPGQKPMPGSRNSAHGQTTQTTAFEVLMRQTNAKDLTPLALAAAEGSCKMFCHLFDYETSVAWVYGPVTCTKLYLDGVDVAIPSGSSAKTEKMINNGEADSTKDKTSILELLAKHCRSDILSHSCIDKLIDIKWRKYGERIFRRKLLFSTMIASMTFVLPMVQTDTSAPWKMIYTVCHLMVAFGAHFESGLVERGESALSKLIFGYPPIEARGDLISICKNIFMELFCFLPKGALSMRKQLTELRQTILSYCAQLDSPHWNNAPKTIGRLSSIKQGDSSIVPAGASSSIWEKLTKSAAAISFLLLCSFVVRAWVPAGWYPPEDLLGGLPFLLADFAAVTFHTLEISLYAFLGLVTFWNFVSLVVAIDREYGLYIQMLLNITCQDLPIFFAVYTIVLLMFSYCHFLASNQVSSGVGEAMDSIWGIFSAMIGRFHSDTTKVARDSPFLLVVTGISVANYFLVTVVLVNLLIAQISNTFKETRAAARGLRKLRRARIMVEIDRAMSAEQREHKDYVYWYAGSDDRRMITLNQHHTESDRLQNKQKQADN